MSRFTAGFLAAVLEEESVEPCLIHQIFQYLVAQSASLKATVCMMVSIGSSQIDTPWSYIKSHVAVTDGKSESLGARDQAVEMFLVPWRREAFSDSRWFVKQSSSSADMRLTAQSEGRGVGMKHPCSPLLSVLLLVLLISSLDCANCPDSGDMCLTCTLT